MPPVFITDISAVLPNSPVNNDEMESVLGLAGDRPSRARRTVLRSNGIQSRHYAIDPSTGNATHTNAQLTAEAVRQLSSNNYCISSLDCLVCGTSLPDQLMPNHAVMVHGELGNPSCEVVGTAGICIAGMTALKYAFLGVAAGEFSNAVATGSEVCSGALRGQMFDSEIEAKLEALEQRPEVAFEKDFLRWMLSDGAGAMLLQPRPRTTGVSLRIEWILQRSYANEMDACMFAGAQKNDDGQLIGWRQLPPDSWLADSVFAIKQDVRQLNENIVNFTVERPLREIRQNQSLTPNDVDYFVPHYSSEFFRQKLYDGLVRADFEIPYERWHTNLTQKGNTGSASIYIMLDELLRSGKLQPSQTILCYVPESGRFSTAFMLLTVYDDR